MDIIYHLNALPGVVAAGHYSYHGDQLSYSYVGELDEAHARMASVMCRATTLGVHMQAEILGMVCGKDCGLKPARSWMVRGPRYTVCVVANVFCFVDNEQGAINEVMARMRKAAANQPQELVY